MFQAKLALAASFLGWSSSRRSMASAQPIIYEEYDDKIFADPYMPEYFCGDGNFPNDDKVACYTNSLLGLAGTPSTAEYLAMFSDKFIEVDGRVYTVKNADNTGGFPFLSKYPDTFDWNENGLYEVRGGGDPCVYYQLLFRDDNIGQIVPAADDFNPIKIIGVDRVTNRIWGYGQFHEHSPWERKRTVWGRAKDGSLVAEPKVGGGTARNAGMSQNDA